MSDSSSQASSGPRPAPPSRQTSEEQLKLHHWDMIHALNTFDFDVDSSAYQFFSADFKARMDIALDDPVLNREEMLRMLFNRNAKALEVRDLSVAITPDLNHASVYLEMEVKGRPAPDLRSRGMAVWKWRREDDGWACFSCTYLKNLCDTAPF